MMKTSSAIKPGHMHHHRQESVEYRCLLVLAFLLFLAIATLTRLMPKEWRPLAAAADQPESVIAEAKRTAHTVVPFAFMN